jgi:hypothetical protein
MQNGLNERKEIKECEDIVFEGSLYFWKKHVWIMKQEQYLFFFHCEKRS